MRAHLFEAKIVLPFPRGRVFRCLVAAEHRGLLLPADLQYVPLSKEPATMREDVILDYAYRRHRLAMHWRTRITLWDPPHRFIDEQLRGPFAKWVQDRQLTDTPEGTLLVEQVEYALPFAPLTNLLLPLYRREFDRLWRHRYTALSQLLERNRECPPLGSEP